MITECPHCAGLGIVFECPRWPSCGCPDGGGMRDSCPGKTIKCVCQASDVEEKKGAISIDWYRRTRSRTGS